MRNSFLKLSLLAATLAPLAAHAASLDQLVITSPGGPTYTIVFPSSTTVFTTIGSGVAYELTGLQETTTVGTTSTVRFDDAFDFGSTSVVHGALFDNNPNLALMPTSGLQLFTLSGGTLSFNPVTGTASDEIVPPDSITYTYTLSAYVPPPSPAPEPSSLILLGTGALGVAGSLRRRLFA